MAKDVAYSGITSTAEVQGTGNLRAKRMIDNIASEDVSKYDVLPTLQAASKVADTYVTAKNSSDAVSARAEIERIKIDNEFLGMSDTGKADYLDVQIQGLNDKSQAYRDSYIHYGNSLISGAREGRIKETNNAHYNTFPTAYASWKQAPSGEYEQGFGVEEGREITNGELFNKQDYIDMYSTKFNLEKPVLARALLQDEYGTLIQDLQHSPNTVEAMNEILEAETEVSKEYSNPQFLTTKQKQGKEIVTAIKTEWTNAVNAKKAAIKNESYIRKADAINGGYRTLPSEIEKDIDITSSNPYTAEKEKIAYTEKHQERTQADDYNFKNPIGDRQSFVPDNPVLKEERQAAVTNELVANLEAQDYNSFVRVATNESGMTKQMGEQLVLSFNNATTTKEIQPLLNQFNSIDAYPGGATVLNTMITQEEYTRIKSIGYALQARPELTPAQARDWIDGNKAKINQLGLDPGKKSKMLEYAIGLGSQADAYLTHMTEVMKGNPSIGDKEMKDAAKRFSSFNQKDSTGKKVDVSTGPLLSSDPSVMEPEKVDEKVNSALGENTTEVKYLPNGIIVGKDNFGGTMTIINSNSSYNKDGMLESKGIIDRANSETEERILEEKAQEREDIKTDPIVGAKVATKAFIRTLVDNVGTIGTGLSESGGTLYDRFTTHLYDSMEPSQQKWWDDLTEEDKSDIISEEIDNKKNELTINEEQLSGTMSLLTPENRVAFNEAAKNNKLTIERLNEYLPLLTKIVPDSFISHLALREGKVNETYKDSRGYLTAGVGHLLTAEEKKKYPLGTKIPEGTVQDWLKKDSAKAYNTAKKQAEELKETSPKFISALASVNFQLGVNWTKKFPSAYRALKNKDYETAIQEILYTSKGSGIRSNWYKQTPVRVTDFVKAIEELKE